MSFRLFHTVPVNCIGDAADRDGEGPGPPGHHDLRDGGLPRRRLRHSLRHRRARRASVAWDATKNIVFN